MDCGDPIGAVRANDREIGHTDLALLALLNEAYAAHSAFVVRGMCTHLVKQAAVDLKDDFQVARQE
jgi:hypothetical protein